METVRIQIRKFTIGQGAGGVLRYRVIDHPAGEPLPDDAKSVPPETPLSNWSTIPAVQE